MSPRRALEQFWRWEQTAARLTSDIVTVTCDGDGACRRVACRARAAVSAISGVGIVDKSFGAGVGRPGSLSVGFGLAQELETDRRCAGSLRS